MKHAIYAIAVPLSLFFTSNSTAGLANTLKPLVGWSVVHAGTVTGFVTKDGEKKDSFEGCEYGRKLIIDYRYVVTCQTYSYSYAFHPDAVLLVKGSSYKLVVDNDVYEVTK